MSTGWVRCALVIGIVLLGGCPLCPDEYIAPGVSGARWEAADALFHQEPRWLGGDGAYSIDLGDDRSVWLFGDSFIATTPNHTRRESTLVRNSIAVMTGRDPLTATMEFAWQDGTTPGSYFPEAGDHWFWPVHGVRLEHGPLLIFLSEIAPTPGLGLGFAAAGFRVVRVRNPDLPPAQWTIEAVASVPAPADLDASVGACVAVDRDHLVAVSVDGDSMHRGRLARWPLFVVGEGDLSEPEWLSNGEWIAQAALTRNPDVVFPDAGSECSLVGDGSGGWLYVASRGFGNAPIAVRAAASLEGPWDEQTQPVFTPDGGFVYAGKAHPQLRVDGDHDQYLWNFAVTYADNSFTFADLLDPANEHTLYWPHFVRIQLSYPSC